MKLLPAEVVVIFLSLRLRRSETSGESSEPYVAVAMKHWLGGVVCDVDDDEAVVEVVWDRTLNCVCCAAVKLPL
jgi:hypothetical protein